MSEKLWPDHEDTPEPPADAASNLERIEKLEGQVEELTDRLNRFARSLSSLLPCE